MLSSKVLCPESRVIGLFGYLLRVVLSVEQGFFFFRVSGLGFRFMTTSRKVTVSGRIPGIHK